MGRVPARVRVGEGVARNSAKSSGVSRPREWLQVIIDDGDDEAEPKEKALAEHVARHPEDVGRMVEDFNWVLSVIVRPTGGRS